MHITIANSSGDPKLATAMLRCMPIPQWQELLDSLAPIPFPDGVKLLTVCFDERLPRTHFDQKRRGMFQSTVTGIDKQHFLTSASTNELRDYLFDFVAESFERVDWPAEIRQRASDIFRHWRATLPSQVSDL